MLDKIKRILILLLILIESLYVGNLLFAESNEFEVKGSFGTETVIVPEGMTIEQAYVEMARLYLEERADNEKLIEQFEDLKQKASDFELVSIKLKSMQEEVIEKNKEIIKLYQKLTSPVFLSPLVEFGITTSTFKQIDSISLGLGVEILEKALLSISLSYPFSIGIKAGVKF